MRLIRGTKLHKYLSGIPVRQPFGKGELIRPLLTLPKMKVDENPSLAEDEQ